MVDYFYNICKFNTPKISNNVTFFRKDNIYIYTFAFLHWFKKTCEKAAHEFRLYIQAIILIEHS